jgi:hypothetical protein
MGVYEEIISDSYNFVRENLANSDIYFGGHVKPVARMCKKYSIQFGGNPFVCEMGGLFHDIGYTEDYSPVEEDHIIQGQEITRDFLTGKGLEGYFLNKIVDCVRTHDGNLDKNSPIENVIVNDCDAISYFDQIPTMLRLMGRWSVGLKEGIGKLRVHGVETYSNVSNHPFFRELADERYDVFSKNLDYFDDKIK